MDQRHDDASIKPVSSLRSHFEALQPSRPSTDDLTPHKDPPVATRLNPTSQNIFPLRASLDLPRPNSPWSSTDHHGFATPRTPAQPAKRSESPTKSKNKRPMSMQLHDSPKMTPTVNVESPTSPPRSFFDRSGSRSPERGVDNSSFGKVRDLISQHSSRTSTRPPSRTTSVDNYDTPSAEVATGVTSDAEHKVTPKPPPSVNRAEKPKIPAKPMSIRPVNGVALTPDARRPSMESRVSPFSTPPDSDDDQPNHKSISPNNISDTSPDADAVPIPRRPSHTTIACPTTPLPIRSTDPRFLGFSMTPTSTERKDPRSVGFDRAESVDPKSDLVVPARANTVVDRPSTRDARDQGFQTIKPTQRYVSEQVVPSSFQKSEYEKPPKDPRQMGFSTPISAPPRVDEERPNLPLRPSVMAAPPRPNEEGKPASGKTQKLAPPPPAPRSIPDRSRKPSAPQVMVKASIPTSASDSYLPPPKRISNADNDIPLAHQKVVSRSVDVNASNPSNTPIHTSSQPFTFEDDDQEPQAYDSVISRVEYPDSTQSNRRVPFFRTGQAEINCKSDVKSFDVAGQYLCTAGYTTRVFDMSTGETIMGLNHGETIKVLAVAFKPAPTLSEEGKTVWLGTNTGEIYEIDVNTRTVLASSTSHSRREVVRILRNRKDMWTLDIDGKLFIWKSGESGTPSLKYSHFSHMTQRGHTFSINIKDKLWLATGRDIRIYRPGNDTNFIVLTKPLSQQNGGDVTSGTYSDKNGGEVFFGHVNGNVTIYSTKDYSLVANVKASDYKINGLSFVGDYLWTAFKTGKIYVYDTSVTPWKVKKDWIGHKDPPLGILFDPSTFSTMNRLQVTTVGHDNIARLWDALLEDDWVDDEVHSRADEYCAFDEMRAVVITWNAGASNPKSLRGNDFISDSISSTDPAEVLVLGLQEVVDLEDRTVTAKGLFGLGKKKDVVKTEQYQTSVYRAWRDYFSDTIRKYLSAQADYVEVQSSNEVGLFQCIFVRKDVYPSLHNLASSSVKCGIKGLYGNKGALITRFIVNDSSMCFVNCHLAAGQTQTSSRNADVATILESDALPREENRSARSSHFVGGGDGRQILDHEICILNGDLNYRIDRLPRKKVIEHIERNEFQQLLRYDQLLLSRKRVAGFKLLGFKELPITFAPTYKYDVGTNKYDTSEKQRAPAWCDRILCRGTRNIQQVTYERHEVQVSDHRPVSGQFKMKVKTIDHKLRDKLVDECHKRFTKTKRQPAEMLSITYMIEKLGFAEADSRQWIESLQKR